MTNFIYFDVMNMYEVMPSIRYFNLQCHYAAGITLKILKSIQTFNEPFVPLYISNIDPLKAIEEYNYFLDNKYWNTSHQAKWYKRIYNDHFIWTSNSSIINKNLTCSPFYLTMYPVVDLIDPYVPAERPRFRERFYGFQRKDYIINYLVKEQLMHWDYRGKIFISTNLYWQDQGRATNSMNNAMTGAFILWYEHYGSVEIGLKALYAYFYMMSYPDIEDLTNLEGNSPFSHIYHMYNISQHWGRIGLSKEYEDIFTEIPNIFWEKGQWR